MEPQLPSYRHECCGNCDHYYSEMIGFVGRCMEYQVDISHSTRRRCDDWKPASADELESRERCWIELIDYIKELKA